MNASTQKYNQLECSGSKDLQRNCQQKYVCMSFNGCCRMLSCGQTWISSNPIKKLCKSCLERNEETSFEGKEKNNCPFASCRKTSKTSKAQSFQLALNLVRLHGVPCLTSTQTCVILHWTLGVCLEQVCLPFLIFDFPKILRISECLHLFEEELAYSALGQRGQNHSKPKGWPDKRELTKRCCPIIRTVPLALPWTPSKKQKVDWKWTCKKMLITQRLKGTSNLPSPLLITLVFNHKPRSTRGFIPGACLPPPQGENIQFCLSCLFISASVSLWLVT